MVLGWSSLFLKRFGYFSPMKYLVKKDEKICYVGKLRVDFKKNILGILKGKYAKNLNFYSDEIIVETVEDPYVEKKCEVISLPIYDENYNEYYFVINPTGKIFSIKDSHGEYNYDLMDSLKIGKNRLSRFESSFEELIVKAIPSIYRLDLVNERQKYHTAFNKLLKEEQNS